MVTIESSNHRGEQGILACRKELLFLSAGYALRWNQQSAAIDPLGSGFDYSVNRVVAFPT